VGAVLNFARSERPRSFFYPHHVLEVALIPTAISGVRFYRARGLPGGAAPPYTGVFIDGSHIKVGAGGTATFPA
jgi:hypothetical protein